MNDHTDGGNPRRLLTETAGSVWCFCRRFPTTRLNFSISDGEVSKLIEFRPSATKATWSSTKSSKSRYIRWGFPFGCLHSPHKGSPLCFFKQDEHHL